MLDLHEAAEQGDVGEVKRLLAAGADVNASDDDGGTALHWAVAKDNLEIARLLLQHGADPNAGADRDMAPLGLAAIGGRTKMATLLCEHGAEVNHRGVGDESALHTAAYEGHAEVVEALLQHGAEIDITKEDGSTPMSMAARYRHSDAVKVLVNWGANVNAQDTRGWTPLHIAARYGTLEHVRLLLERGADVASRTVDGATPLFVAASRGSREWAEEYLAKDPDEYVAHMAAMKDSTEVVSVLLLHGAEINAPTAKGISPLDAAVVGGDSEMAQLLREHGAVRSRTAAEMPVVTIGEWLAESWNMVSQDLGLHIVLALIVFVGSIATGGILSPPLICGYVYIVIRKLQEPAYRPQIADVAKGFDVFVQALLAGIVGGVICNLGALACGIGAAVGFALVMFALPLVIDRRMDFWAAVQTSISLTGQQLVTWTLLVLTLWLINALGLLACGLGLLVTWPISYVAIVLAYRDSFGLHRGASSAT